MTASYQSYHTAAPQGNRVLPSGCSDTTSQLRPTRAVSRARATTHALGPLHVNGIFLLHARPPTARRSGLPHAPCPPGPQPPFLTWACGAAPTATRQPQQPRQLGPLRACRHSSLSNPTCAREPAHWSFALRLGPLPVFQGTDSPLPRTPLFTGCTRNMAPPPAFDEGLRKLPLMAEDKGEPMCARQRKRERWEVPGSFPRPVLMRTKILGLDPDTQMPSEMDLEGHANVCSLLSFTPRPSRLSGCLTPLQLESSSNGLPGLSRYFELAISSARRSCVFSGIPLQKISEYEPMPSDVASAQLLTRLFLGPSRANNLFM
ncbi:uncharacterized protein LOC129048488 [Pongo abelii]|uniref:uncharacterized protein LOC129048488 n=1 Tax=Pongo abelii TaxID=9601 RepID=UPI0030053E6E